MTTTRTTPILHPLYTAYRDAKAWVADPYTARRNQVTRARRALAEAEAAWVAAGRPV